MKLMSLCAAFGFIMMMVFAVKALDGLEENNVWIMQRLVTQAFCNVTVNLNQKTLFGNIFILSPETKFDLTRWVESTSSKACAGFINSGLNTVVPPIENPLYRRTEWFTGIVTNRLRYL